LIHHFEISSKRKQTELGTKRVLGTGEMLIDYLIVPQNPVELNADANSD
jgi:hypothetical protein